MNKKTLINSLLVIISILMISFFVKDWLVFYNCGAVEQCLVESSNYQNIAKFAVTTIMAIIVFFIGDNCLCKRDRTILQAGPHYFAGGFCNGILRRLLLKNHAQLRSCSRTPQRLHAARHLLFHGRASAVHLSPHTHKRH